MKEANQGEIYLNGQKIANLKNITFSPSPSTRAPLPPWPEPHNASDPANTQKLTWQLRCFATWLKENAEAGWRWNSSYPGITPVNLEKAADQLESQGDEQKLIAEPASLARKKHYYCEDSWYSCPKATDGCANDSAGNECNCGADEHNAKVDALVRQLKSSTD